MPLASLPKKTEAAGLSGYVSGLAPAVAALPLCQGKIKGAVASLFGNRLAAANAAGDAAINAVNRALSDKANESLSQVGSISTYDPSANGKLNFLVEAQREAQKSLASLDSNDTCLKNIGQLVIKMLLQKLTLSTVNWINSGFDGKPAFIQDPSKFFKDIAKNEILQFGLEINNPELFPFGKEWLKNQALAYNNKFADNARYSLNDLIQKTTPQYSAQSFQVDFSQGGWDAWTAMTQVPANNPLGFQLLASDELSKRLQGTANSTAQNVHDALQQANGFLGDLRCVDSSGSPTNITQQQKNAALAAGRPDPCIGVGTWQYVTPGKLIADAATSAAGYPKDSLLKADDLNSAVAAILDALLSRFSTTLMQKGFASIGDQGADGSFVYDPNSAFLNDNSQTLHDFTPIQLSSSWLSANPDFNIRTDLTQALIDEQRTYSDKLKEQNKELNSTTDGKDYKMNTLWTFCANENQTCSVPGTRQVRYGAKDKYNFRTVTGNIACNNASFTDPIKNTVKTCAYRSWNGSAEISNAYGLMPTIAQLDYCIPGPHPGWEDDSRNVLNAVTDTILPITAEDMKEKGNAASILKGAGALAPVAATAAGTAIGASIGSGFPGVGTVIGAIVGSLVGFAITSFTDGDYYLRLRSFYSSQIKILTGIDTDYPDDEASTATNLLSKEGTVQSLNVILNRYIDLMHLVYNQKILPTVFKEAANEYNKLPGYSQMIVNNENAIFDKKNVVTTLTEIKNQVDNLNTKKNNGQITDDQYESQLKTQIDAFGRVSANMVNGDDIAEADSLLNQIIDEKNYVYKDLLKGPNGCEKDLELARQGMPTNLYATSRMDYPFPILYTYNIPANGDIPDTLKDSSGQPISGLVIPNKMNTNATAVYGPGFLSFYSFQRESPRSAGRPDEKKCIANEDGSVAWCELKISDLIPIEQTKSESGIDKKKRNLGTTSDATTGPFEHTIGVY